MKKRWKFFVPIWTLPKEVYCSTYPGFSFGNWSVCLPSFLIPFNFFQSQGDMNLNYFALLHFMRCGKAIPIHRRFWQKMEHFSLRDLILPFSEEKSHQENSIGLPSLLLEPPFVNIIKCCNALSAIKSWGCWSGIALLHFYARWNKKLQFAVKGFESWPRRWSISPNEAESCIFGGNISSWK